MIALYYLPQGTEQASRIQSLKVLMNLFAAEKGWEWVDWREAAGRRAFAAAEARVALVAVFQPSDLELLACLRRQTPAVRPVVVVLVPDPQLLLRVHDLSPCFIAVGEADEAAMPAVLERLSCKEAGGEEGFCQDAVEQVVGGFEASRSFVAS